VNSFKNQISYDATVGYFINIKSFELYFNVEDRPSDIIYPNNFPANPKTGKPYFSDIDDVAYIDKAAYDEWNYIYRTNEYVFVKADDGSPYWSWKDRPSQNTIDLNNAPTICNGLPCWSSN
jgi:hypothetical protein